MENNATLAEITESNLQGWTAQCWQWDISPSFGSLVTAQSGERTHVGLVYQIETGSFDPSRTPFAYRKTEAELRAQHPHIFEFLRTNITAIAVGYEEHGHLFHTIAPTPPKIHTFVSPASDNIARRFFSQSTFLALLCNQAMPINTDELLLAMIRQYQQSALTPERISTTMRTYAQLAGGDYRRARLFIQRVEQLVSHQ